MTKTMLHRTAILAKKWRRKGTLLLLSGNADMEEVRSRLRNEPAFSRKIKVRNPWDELRSTPDRKLKKLVGENFAKSRSVEDTLTYEGNNLAKRANPAGDFVQTDRFRANGTVYLSHRRDMRKRGTPGGSRVTLFGQRGEVLAEWSTPTAFYQAWIDYVVGERPAYLFSDSNFVGPLLTGYRRQNVTTVQTLHEPHLHVGTTDPNDVLRPVMHKLVSRIEGFDLTAVLTQQQADDMALANLADNVEVVPNMQPQLTSNAPLEREPTQGILVGRLSEQKQIDHAIKAMALVNNTQTHLDIFGSGELRGELEEVIRDVGVGNTVKLRGHDPAAKSQFEKASFSVLSSLYEGQPLVILESMAAGCIPVAYDIKYGPESMITDGVDGFLVPAGDIQALAAAIERVTTLDSDSLRSMRLAAVERMKRFSNDEVANIWSEALTRARRAKSSPTDLDGTAVLSHVQVKDGAFEIEFTFSYTGTNPLEYIRLAWIGRDAPVYGRVKATNNRDDGVTFSSRLPTSSLAFEAGGLLDLYVDARANGDTRRTRLASGMVELPALAENAHIYSTKFGNVSIRVDSR